MLISSQELKEVKSRIDLVALIASYGIALKKQGAQYLGLCPFHADHNPSLVVHPAKGLWNCLGACRGQGKSGGDAIAFVMKKEGLAFPAALQKLQGRGGESPPSSAAADPAAGVLARPDDTSDPTATVAQRAERLGPIVEYYHHTLLESPAGQAYLEQRGLCDGELIRTFKLGYADGTLRSIVPSSGEALEPLKQIGILTPRGGEFFRGCIVVPIHDAHGAVVNLYGRHTAKRQHLYLPGPLAGVFNGTAVKAATELILTESIFDALSLCRAGFRNTIPIYGINGWTADHRQLLERYRTRRVYLCFDADEAGQKATQELSHTLGALGIETATIKLPVKDANEFFCTGPEAAPAFKGLLEQAAAAVRRPAASAGRTEAGTEIENGLVYRTGPRSYRVRGWNGQDLAHLRANVRVEQQGRVYLDTLDLYVARQRRLFARRAAETLPEKAEALEAELLQVIEALEWRQAQKPEGKSGPRVLSETERAEALALLQSPDLLSQIDRALDTLGYVGEEANKRLLYLVAISRKLAEPLSAIILSQSGAGKSSLAEAVEQLCPPEDVVLYSRVTPQALYYMDRDALRHKLLIIEERAGRGEADYSIRTLQSRKKLVLAVPIKDPNSGKIRTFTVLVEGPIAYIETTTETAVHPENATRCFEVYMDESAAQTRRIHERQREAKTLAGVRRQAEAERLLRLHQNAQRLLQPVKVVNPYAHLLRFPERWLRTRRDHVRFLNLIEALTFLHQYQRERQHDASGLEYIASTVADYGAAYAMAGELVRASVSELKKPAGELLDVIRAHGAGERTFTRRQVRQWSGLPNHQVKALMSELEDLEWVYLEKTPPRGGRYEYRLADASAGEQEVLAGLLTPEELTRLWPG